MTANIERRPSLRKASLPEDLVAGITRGRSEPPPEMGEGAEAQPVTKAPEAVAQTEPVVVRRGVGRPRSRRRMEPFSSKIEIGLRDQVDEYTAQHGESIVDLLDRALRAAIARPPEHP